MLASPELEQLERRLWDTNPHDNVLSSPPWCYMLPTFDIFRVEPDGEVLWAKSAADLRSARLAVQELMASSPHEYVIHSHRTGNDLIVRPPRAVKRRAKPVIFQIAYDEGLLASRALLLKSYGFTVVSAFGNEAAKLALEKPKHYGLLHRKR